MVLASDWLYSGHTLHRSHRPCNKDEVEDGILRGCETLAVSSHSSRRSYEGIDVIRSNKNKWLITVSSSYTTSMQSLTVCLTVMILMHPHHRCYILYFLWQCSSGRSGYHTECLLRNTKKWQTSARSSQYRYSTLNYTTTVVYWVYRAWYWDAWRKRKPVKSGWQMILFCSPKIFPSYCYRRARWGSGNSVKSEKLTSQYRLPTAQAQHPSQTSLPD